MLITTIWIWAFSFYDKDFLCYICYDFSLVVLLVLVELSSCYNLKAAFCYFNMLTFFAILYLALRFQFYPFRIFGGHGK